MSLILLILATVIAVPAALLALPVLAVVALGGRLVGLLRVKELASDRWSRPETLHAPSPLVVAIHGTFAQKGKATWTFPGSRLHTALTEAIRCATGVTPGWYVFNWTGDNSAAGRRSAVEALADVVRQSTEHQPDRFVLLVGHSHGGNIAATVAQRFSDRTGLHVVTMATPFLTVIQRAGTEELGKLLSVYPSAALTLVALVVARGVLHWSWPWVAAMTFGTLILTGLLFARLQRQTKPTLEALRTATLNPMLLDALRPRMFIVSRIGDEADASLKLTAFATNWVIQTMGSVGLVGATESLADRLRRDGGAGKPGLTLRDARLLGGYAWQARTSVVELVALGCGRVLLSLLQLVAGTSSALVSVGLNVGSSETPPGVWHHLQSTWSGARDASLLSHSQIYDDEAVVEAVANWAGERSKGPATAP